MGRIFIDGREFVGNSITIRNGVVTVDGVRQEGTLSGVVELRIVEGTVGHLECDGSVTAGNIHGDVKAGGSVTCDDVGGNVIAGGSVTCDNIGGSVMAGGSVRR